jgi:hypothetical protein
LNAISAESNLYDRIVLAQLNDGGWFEQRLVVPADPKLQKEIFDEAHLSKFSIHLGSTKMYQYLRINFWWSNMKVDITKYVAECDTFRVKDSHLKSVGVLQPLTVPLWTWDDISMDFIVGLPLTARNKDSMWVIVDRLTKTAHFIVVHTTYSVQDYAELYVDQIVRLHVNPKTIVSDRGTQFVAHFWERLHEPLGTK